MLEIARRSANVCFCTAETDIDEKTDIGMARADRLFAAAVVQRTEQLAEK